MSDLIDRQAAIEDIREYKVEPNHCCDESEIKGYNDGLDTAISALATLPSAQPEIIRCKDCKHRYIEDMIWHCPFGLMGGEDFFCGYGSFGNAERKIYG